MEEQITAVASELPPAQDAFSLRRLNGRWVVWGERTLILILVFLFITKGFIPAWKHLNTDFPNYYIAARLFHQGYPIERVYEWIWFQRQKDHLGVDQRLVGFIPLTLPSILPVMPLSSLPALQAKHIWLLMNLAFLALSIILLKACTRLDLQRVALLTFLAVFPLRDSFLYGQMHIFVLLLLVVSTWLYFKDSLFFSGLLLAVAAAVKIYPALFLVFFIFKKQWRAAIALGAGLTGAILISLYVFGWDACWLYALEVLPRGLRGEVTDPYSFVWNSLTALLRRLFLSEPELNPNPVAHLPSLYAFLQPAVHGVIFVAFMWVIGSKTEDRARTKLEWATYSFLLVLLSSQTASYHLVVLTLTAALAVDYLLTQGRAIPAALVVALYALSCGPLFHPRGIQAACWSNLLFFPRLALLLLLGATLLWALINLSPEPISVRFNLRSSLLAGAALIPLVTIGFMSNLQHLKGQFENYGTRLLTVEESALAMDPVETSEGLFFTALVPRFPPTAPNTYGVHELKNGSVISFAGTEDWFHPAVGANGHPAWAELATSGGSRIMDFARKPVSTDDATVEVENAEQPIVSADGEWFAFVREVNGRDSLWIRSERTMQPHAERQIAGPQYDVRDATFFPDHRMVFSSRHNGRFRLYEVNPELGSIEEMRVPTCSARYPAISPDGKWIAFSCEHRGAWQIHVMNLSTSEQTQLTDAACNSISPTWTGDSKELIYATDCGRGLGLTALSKLQVFQ